MSGTAELGALSVAWGPGREPTADERRLLADLGRHGGIAVQAVWLADELRAGRERLVVAREEERRRLRRNLHDEVGPTLAGLAMQLGVVRTLVADDPTAAADRLGLLQDAARTALGTLRRMAHDLRPPALDELGLAGALQQLGETLGLRLRFTGSQPERLPAAVEVAAYRIGAEALHNVVRHAGTDVVELTVDRVGGELLLVVRDDGAGRAPGSPPASGCRDAGAGRRARRDRRRRLRARSGNDGDRAAARPAGGVGGGGRVTDGGSRVRVVLADDHPMFREGLRFTLEREPDLEVVGEAADGRAVLDLVADLDPDVVLMDLAMPVLDGLTATRELVGASARSRILVLTMSEDDDSVLAAVRAGACGYLVKGADPEQVVSAVRAVARGHAVFGASLAGRLLGLFASPLPSLPQLSLREKEVLDLLAEGMTNAEIGRALFISPITVRNHLSSIFGKLHVSTRGQAVAWVRGRPGTGDPSMTSEAARPPTPVTPSRSGPRCGPGSRSRCRPSADRPARSRSCSAPSSTRSGGSASAGSCTP